MTTNSNSTYIKDGYLYIDTKEYGELRFYLLTEKLSTLNFSVGNRIDDVEYLVRSLKALSSDYCQLIGYPVNQKLTFNINRVEYGNLSLMATVTKGVCSLYCKASYAKKYSSDCQLTSSAKKKLTASLEVDVNPSIEAHLQEFIEVTRQKEYEYIRRTLNEYKENVIETIKGLDAAIDTNDLDAATTYMKSQIDTDGVDLELLDELLTTIINEFSVYLQIEQLATRWNNRELNKAQLWDNLKRLVIRFMKQYHDRFIEDITFNQWAVNSKVSRPLTFEVFLYYSDSSYQLFT